MPETISIVIPVYNAERYLKKCIESIQKQSYSSWKLILVDDGSTDASGAMADVFAMKDKRIHVIHQKNKGSVEARKSGIMCEEARRNSYMLMVDADDELPPNALKNMYKAIKQFDGDCVCGDMQRLWHGIHIPQRYKAECFKIDSPQIYSHEEIQKIIFISFFGISNFPVNLWAKLYKTEYLINAIDFPPVVKFMGEDLSVTIRVISTIKKLVIIPDVVYYYRVGGGTWKYMPYMMEDFVNLYRYKKEFADRYPMPQNAKYYMDVELLNVTKTHFLQCIKCGKFSKERLTEEIEKTCIIFEVSKAAEQLMKLDNAMAEYAALIYRCDSKAISAIIDEMVRKDRGKDFIKNLIKRL